MRMYTTIWVAFLLSLSCKSPSKKEEAKISHKADTAIKAIAKTVINSSADTSVLKVLKPDTSAIKIYTGNVDPYAVLAYSKTLVGTPYKYASTNPKKGFDCSGFITYVFNHFNIKVPRSSIDFTDVGNPIPVDYARPGDLILFTGTDSTKKIVGHIGIISGKDTSGPVFIHSSSGKAHGVTITPFNQYYKTRFMKVIRVFPQKEAIVTKK